MLTDAQKQLLKQAQDLLEQADALVQEALGHSDVCYETHTRIQDLVDDLQADIEDN